ncbi:ABC transporter ATP-binding protein [Nocardioides guangzhouensis]|uniref:ABC transporter ATP-binding protein n=1 Tax=Nocardioides guangzhouensis TaxID=2497878 RepID=A0A4Q4ZL24_9ACTN|nr:ABC transporter ATP-binding protein [Nocardioides guangzhouensis]RYP88281.1 ABC transporter ATP-binding protein [Nocardioides guangzhouensis]
MSGPLLEMSDVWLRLPEVARRPVLAGVDLQVGAGEIVGLVGESGSGKSVTARAALGLLPPTAEVEGRVTVDGVDVLSAPAADVRRLRAESVAMVFQDPRAGINPMRRIGDHLTESARLTGRRRDLDAARARALELLDAVGLPDPRRHLRQYPHELSGGMLQRVMIAGALMGSPRLLLCDEPTTALDVTTQAEIVALLGRLQRERGMGMLFITHDLDLAASVCDRIHVMYAGRVVEQAPALGLFEQPRHPYTAGLLASTPAIDGGGTRLRAIPGVPLSLLEDPSGCVFAARCDRVLDEVCRVLAPPVVADGVRSVRCARPLEARTPRHALRTECVS